MAQQEFFQLIWFGSKCTCLTKKIAKNKEKRYLTAIYSEKNTLVNRATITCPALLSFSEENVNNDFAKNHQVSESKKNS